VGSLIVKASQKIKFMNKYIEGLKSEMEETSEKYDRLAIKFRDINKAYEQIKNICDVTHA
jgi:hypothetical protein